MKKIRPLFLLGATLFFNNHASAQYLVGGFQTDSALPKIEFGIKLGGDLQSITGNFWYNAYKPAIVGGIFVGMRKRKIGVRLEILANTSRYTSIVLTDSAGNKGDFRAVFLDIPLLFEYRIAPKVKLLAGPEYSNMLSIASVDGFSSEVKSLFKQSEFSGVIGLEVKLPKKIAAGARFIYGFTNLNNEQVSFVSETWSNRTIQLYVSYNIAGQEEK